MQVVVSLAALYVHAEHFKASVHKTQVLLLVARAQKAVVQAVQKVALVHEVHPEIHC